MMRHPGEAWGAVPWAVVLLAAALGAGACGDDGTGPGDGGDGEGGTDADGAADADADADDAGDGDEGTDVPDVPCAPLTWYVDFDNGDDTNDGTCRDTAWRHAPGDPEATGVPAAATLAPGWTVLFRGGVVYRGSIALPADGADGAPLVYRGDGWGAERAIIDGSEPLADGWTRCGSAEDCRGAPGWNNIWYRDVSGATAWSALYEGDGFLWLAEDPNPDDPLFFDNTSSFRVVPLGSAEISLTRTTLTDPTYFTQADPGYWNGAWVAAWVQPNVVVFAPLTAYDPVTHAVSYALDNDPYTDRDAYYAVLNHPALIDAPGEFAVDEGTGRVWLRPRGAGDPAALDVSIARRNYGFDLNGKARVTIAGFRIRKFASLIDEYGMGNGVTNVRTWETTARHDVVRDNEITLLRSMSGSAAVTGGDEDFLVEANFIHENQKSIGVLGGGLRTVIRDNRVVRNGRQGIWFMGESGGTISGNVVTETLGPHSNGISVYLGSADILVADNVVSLSNAALTLQDSQNVYVVGNIFQSNGRGSYVVADWGGITGELTFLHNAILGSDNHCGLMIPADETATVVLRNNILDGGGGFDRAHNLYVGLCWDQDARYGWALADGEALETDLARVFVDPAAEDWRSADGSPAIDAGEDATAFSPTALFPDFRFTQAIDGTERPQGAASDIGPYERGP
jgi:parallel beta-helix repeat protein